MQTYKNKIDETLFDRLRILRDCKLIAIQSGSFDNVFSTLSNWGQSLTIPDGCDLIVKSGDIYHCLGFGYNAIMEDEGFQFSGPFDVDGLKVGSVKSSDTFSSLLACRHWHIEADYVIKSVSILSVKSNDFYNYHTQESAIVNFDAGLRIELTNGYEIVIQAFSHVLNGIQISLGPSKANDMDVWPMYNAEQKYGSSLNFIEL
jgi:hypothetical protein